MSRARPPEVLIRPMTGPKRSVKEGCKTSSHRLATASQVNSDWETPNARAACSRFASRAGSKRTLLVMVIFRNTKLLFVLRTSFLHGKQAKSRTAGVTFQYHRLYPAAE